MLLYLSARRGGWCPVCGGVTRSSLFLCRYLTKLPFIDRTRVGVFGEVCVMRPGNEMSINMFSVINLQVLQ